MVEQYGPGGNQPLGMDWDEAPPLGASIFWTWTGDPDRPDWIESPTGQPVAFVGGYLLPLVQALAAYAHDWTPGEPIAFLWEAISDPWMVAMESAGDHVVITTTFLDTACIVVDAAHFVEDLRRSLRTFAAVMQRNAPSLLALPDLALLADHLSIEPSTAVHPISRRTAAHSPAADHVPAVHGRIAWRLEPDAWAALISARERIQPFSADDADAAVLRAASGWIRFGVDGTEWSIVHSSDHPLFALRPYSPAHRDNTVPETTLLARGYRISVLAFAEFLGWLMKRGPFGSSRADYAVDYVDPVHELALRFIHSEAGAVSIISDRFIDRGNCIHVSDEDFAAAANVFMESINVAIRANAPSLFDLVCLQSVRQANTTRSGA